MTDNATAIAHTSAAEGAFALAQREARALSVSDLVPAAYKGNVPNCLLALDVARRIGANPLAIMQNLHMIQGRPSFASTFLIACVNASGRFSPLRFEFRGSEATKTKAEGWGCRAMATDTAGNVCTGPWVTWAMVEAEGWSKKGGSKWLTMPEVMFHYRAAAFWSRIFAPEVSLGIRTTDEAQDMAREHVEPAAPRGTAANLAAILAEGEPVPETPRSVAPVREPGEDG